MPHFEYKVIPAPTRAEKVKGVKTPEGRFAHSVERELNRMGEAGWEYLRAELLPNEERGGLKAAQTKWRTVLVFRRHVAGAAEAPDVPVLETVLAEPDLPQPVPMPAPVPLVAEPEADPPLQPETAGEDQAGGTVVPLPSRDDDDPAR